MTDLRKAIGKQAKSKQVQVDPIALFRGLKIKNTSPIKEMWAPQADALREWHAKRHASDVLFQLNTGAGKTLIGLVAAQSLVNETRGQVVYCCATNQLVEQTRAKAEELGIPTATYMGGNWTDQDVYKKADGPVLTNYAAVFNGRSIFTRDALTGAVFDDAHTAHDAIRGAYTLVVNREDFGDVYDGIIAKVHDYFDRVGRAYQFEAVVARRDNATVLFVPMFEVQRHAKDFQKLFLANGAEDTTELKFPWAHVGARLDRCAVLISADSVEVTPLLPPVHTHRAFKKGVRRLYLSATMRYRDEFIRTFGKTPELTVAPGGRAGDTERLFLLASSDKIDEAARGWAESASRGWKAVIMVPNWTTAEHWEKYAEIFSSDDGHARIRAFAESKNERLVFVARYDGIDLPDDDCRIMIVDGLPGGLSHLDRFFENHLERAGTSDGKIASRFVQLLGRTSRGMSDYGAVVLVGRRLLEWVLPPIHRALLPAHIQKQLLVGEILGDTQVTPRELIKKCLDQSDDWSDVYQAQMEEVTPEREPTSTDTARTESLAWGERRAAESLWDGQPADAVAELNKVVAVAYQTERPLGAWFAHWLGYAYQRTGDMASAMDRYREAARTKTELGAPPEPPAAVQAADSADHSTQASLMSGLLTDRQFARIERELRSAAAILKDVSASSAKHEEAIQLLGEYLGYKAWRGDQKTGGKAHDVIWEQPDGSRVLFFDAKTKKGASKYTKEYIGQSAQHALWAEKKYPDAERLLYLVGPRVPATPQATPPIGKPKLTPDEVARLLDVTLAVYKRAADGSLPLLRPAEIETGLRASSLSWDELPAAMETVRLESLLT